MISFISGRIVETGENKIVLENNGIGYDITVSNDTLAKCQNKDNVQLYIYMSVREDSVTLFGFFDKTEKEMFLRLITVSGIGPKLASVILSGMSSQQLALKIAAGDHLALSKIKGVGKKTAERIIVELKDKIALEGQSVDLEAQDFDKTPQNISDAIFALMSLGMTKAEAVRAVNKVSDKTRPAEEILAEALKRA
ncbi:MAG: Holliday junction branch migration protein RuvA [Clostridiales bacterium]|jgi:Holliday junction DNA helicase RuvA|nr:Holliday junction branch migration protein RuvA [Clostridiales bacterium]